MPVDQSLSERLVNLYQVPSELQLSFTGDMVNGELIKPVRPNNVTHIPMELRLLPPKTKIDLTALEDYNASLLSKANDPYSNGSALAYSDVLLDAAKDYQYVMDTLQYVPPLLLYINPNDLTRQHTKRAASQFGGDGHIISHWGDEQDKLSATGRIGAYYTTKTGLTRYYRRNSSAYQQLMHLYILYRNNGYIYELRNTRRISLVGSVQLSYDTETWIGHFDTFQMTESSEMPYSMEYSFEFTVKEYHNDTTLGYSL